MNLEILNRPLPDLPYAVIREKDQNINPTIYSTEKLKLFDLWKYPKKAKNPFAKISSQVSIFQNFRKPKEQGDLRLAGYMPPGREKYFRESENLGKRQFGEIPDPNAPGFSGSLVESAEGVPPSRVRRLSGLTEGPRKRVPAKKGPKKINGERLKSMKKLPTFKSLFELVKKFHLNKDITDADLEALDGQSKHLFSLLFRKHYEKRTKDRQLTLALILELKSQPTRKRNEEKIKQIWKRFLRKMFDDFKKVDASQVKGLPTLALPEFSGGRWKRFYFFAFHDLIEKEPKRFSLDLIMDICTEKTVGFVKEKDKTGLPEKFNWRTVSKVAAMKKVPASFRYLVSQSGKYREKFEAYLDRENPQGIVCYMNEIIMNKLRKMFIRWEVLFAQAGRNWPQFFDLINEQIDKPKFKLPWLISDIEKAVEYCKEDIASAKLEREFSELKQRHYTSAQ